MDFGRQIRSSLGRSRNTPSTPDATKSGKYEKIPQGKQSGAQSGASTASEHTYLAKAPYVKKSTYVRNIAVFSIVVGVILFTFGFMIWTYVLEGQNSDGIHTQGRRMSAFNDRLWERCTPQANPPTAFKDEGIYLAQDPLETQFLDGWTSVSHRCTYADPASDGLFEMYFDGTLKVDDGLQLTGDSIRPSYSVPAYLTKWTGDVMTVAVMNRCVLPIQDNAIYIVLQAGTYAPLPCICIYGAGEFCYHYPDPNSLSPLYLNDDNEIP
jgi:hypothetical protein